MERIRVLIVDDSVVACRALSDAVSSDPALEVAGTALSGPIALRQLSLIHPDLVMLDIDMPGMDGLETLGAIRKSHPRLPVIICSGLAEKGNSYTMKALLGGASDYVTKPRHVANRDATMEAFKRELIGKIKAQCPNAPPAAGSWSAAPAAPEAASAPMPMQALDCVAIGISTGGPKALAEIVPHIPADFPVPILVVQHMPADFTKAFAANLARHAHLAVEEAREGARPGPGEIWIAPGGSHLRAVRRGSWLELELGSEPPVNSCRPSVDVLFQSLREACGARLLGVVMTGMGQDGLAGARAIREAGGRIYAQDEASSVVWGMPGAVVKANLADRILPLAEIPRALVAAARKGRR